MKIDNLKFVRLTEPAQFSLIPRRLFEQVKGTDNITERIYQFGPVALASPLTFLYVLAEEKQLKDGYAPVKGILWAEINPLNETLTINVLSLDKEYQGNGIVDKAYEEILKKIQQTERLKKMEMLTTRPEVYEKKHGWRRSDKIILEK
jgi:hypothetical protein